MAASRLQTAALARQALLVARQHPVFAQHLLRTAAQRGFASSAPWDTGAVVKASSDNNGGSKLPPGHVKRPYYHHHDWWKNSKNWTDEVKDSQKLLRRRRYLRILTWVMPLSVYAAWLAGRWYPSVPSYLDHIKDGGSSNPLGRVLDFPLIREFMGSWLGQQFGNMSRRHPNSRWKLAASMVDPTEVFWLEVVRLRNNPEQRAAVLRDAYRLSIRMREMSRLEREALGLEPGKYLQRNLMLRRRRATHEQFMYERCLPFDQRIRYMTVEARLAAQRVAQRQAFIKAFQAAGYPGSKGLEAPPSPLEAELRFGLPRVVL